MVNLSIRLSFKSTKIRTYFQRLQCHQNQQNYESYFLYLNTISSSLIKEKRIELIIAILPQKYVCVCLLLALICPLSLSICSSSREVVSGV